MLVVVFIFQVDVGRRYIRAADDHCLKLYLEALISCICLHPLEISMSIVLSTHGGAEAASGTLTREVLQRQARRSVTVNEFLKMSNAD